MTQAQFLERTQARYDMWAYTAQRNADIRKRIRSGEPAEQVAADYRIAPYTAQRIAGMFGV